MPDNPLLAKLETFSDLRDGDRALLAALCRDIRSFGARRNVIREGERPQQVHSRMLQRLREAELVELHDRMLTVLDVPRLRRLADFDPNYLHIERRQAVPG